MENSKKILWLDESEFCHDIDNFHNNSIGSDFELKLDEILTQKLYEQLGQGSGYIESDFTYMVKGEEVVSMFLFFKIIKDCEYENVKNEYFLEALRNVLKEVFETDDVLLETENKLNSACWIINNKERMLWLIDKLESLGIDTKETFNVVNV